MNKINIEIRKKEVYTDTVSTLMPYAHIHREIEAVYVKSGSAVCYADNKAFEITAGDLFVCFPGQIHCYSDVRAGEYCLMIFSPDIIYGQKNLFLSNVPKINKFTDSCNKISHIADSFCESDEIFDKTMNVGLINQLMAIVLKKSELTERKNHPSDAIQDILLYCNKNFASNISLDIIAKELHLSKYHISHIFSEKIGVGFRKYINFLRINEACKLMKDKKNSIAFVSEETGFGSIRSFNRAFLEIMNITPKNYMKTNK